MLPCHILTFLTQRSSTHSKCYTMAYGYSLSSAFATCFLRNGPREREREKGREREREREREFIGYEYSSCGHVVTSICYSATHTALCYLTLVAVRQDALPAALVLVAHTAEFALGPLVCCQMACHKARQRMGVWHSPSCAAPRAPRGGVTGRCTYRPSVIY